MSWTGMKSKICVYGIYNITIFLKNIYLSIYIDISIYLYMLFSRLHFNKNMELISKERSSQKLNLGRNQSKNHYNLNRCKLHVNLLVLVLQERWSSCTTHFLILALRDQMITIICILLKKMTFQFQWLLLLSMFIALLKLDQTCNQFQSS